MAAGVQPGDVVVTVPHTFIATTEAITQAGARIDFVDIDERTYCMDPAKLQAYLETKCAFDPGTRKAYSPGIRRLRSPRLFPFISTGKSRIWTRFLNWRSAMPDCCRRCLPGPWRRIFLEEAEPLAQGRLDRPCGRIQLLSRERIWARAEKAGRPPRTTKQWREKCACCATTAKPKSIITTWKATTAGSIPFRPESLA